MVSSYVQRNLDNAQFAQSRGSEYEGPSDERETHNPFLCNDCIAGKSHDKYAPTPSNICYRHTGTTTSYGICPICDLEREGDFVCPGYSFCHIMFEHGDAACILHCPECVPAESELRAMHGDR